ncbi:MAG: hypothetical protein EZS28_002902 [Streblomastix strix]|uniref:Mos1 transposase HTH domain-containing protein n=1 Tax=Streblomastix strix TaxID=222440 RepID=A0A5J4X2U7_9EUKA|nr:MAG: hypothetical protein EZS28_002893 [Streblomastix strix]KAA6401580.1 MAG: hypothetical protein EZS28_002902 [Streblomastix strix]
MNWITGVPEYCANIINEAFGEDTVRKRTVQRWFEKFRSGNESVEDLERSGRPPNIDLPSQILMALGAYPFISVRDLQQFMDLPRENI